MSEWTACPKCGVLYKGNHVCKGKEVATATQSPIRVEEREEKFWRDIDVQIEDETKAHDEYRRLARESEQLGIAGWNWLDDIAVDEARHKETLLVIKRHCPAETHSSSSHSSSNKKKFVVRYFDNMGRERTEEIEDDVAFYQRVRREGLSVISIHKK